MGTSGVPGPATRVTSAPRAAAAAAIAAPIFPDERLPRKRTASTASRVPPAVTTTWRPDMSLPPPAAQRPAGAAVSATMSAGSISRPDPIQPQASGPWSGPTVVTRPRRRVA